MVIPAIFWHAPIISSLLDALAEHLNLGFYAHDDLSIASEEGMRVVHLFGDPNSPLAIRLWANKGADIVLRLESPIKTGITQEHLEQYHGVGVVRTLVETSILTVRDGRLVVELRIGRK
jgi:hypothetical protein